MLVINKNNLKLIEKRDITLKYKLNKYEKETIITFNEAETTASVYTCSMQEKNRLKELSLKSSDIYLIKEDEYSQTYTIPKKAVGYFLPRKLSEEEKKKRALLLRQNIEKHKEQNKEDKEE